jgi:NACalpha-BTF3-like transcription factor
MQAPQYLEPRASAPPTDALVVAAYEVDEIEATVVVGLVQQPEQQPSAAEQGTPPASAELLAELGAMKLRALQKKAEELGVGEDQLDAAEEKSEVIALIVQKLDEQAAHEEAVRLAALKDELGAMKLRALQKRAEELGVDEDKLDDAEEKSEVIALILAALAPVEDGAAQAREAEAAAAAAAAAAEAEVARLAQLKEELSAMKLRALQKRAEELGIDGEALDEAEEKSAVIALIMEHAGSKSATKLAPVSAAGDPHFGSASTNAEMVDAISTIFAQWQEQGLHIMFSYQWDMQEQVKAVHALMQKKKIPVWMDVSGGMAADIYDSVSALLRAAAIRALRLTVCLRVRV